MDNKKETNETIYGGVDISGLTSPLDMQMALTEVCTKEEFENYIKIAQAANKEIEDNIEEINARQVNVNFHITEEIEELKSNQKSIESKIYKLEEKYESDRSRMIITFNAHDQRILELERKFIKFKNFMTLWISCSSCLLLLIMIYLIILLRR